MLRTPRDPRRLALPLFGLLSLTACVAPTGGTEAAPDPANPAATATPPLQPLQLVPQPAGTVVDLPPAEYTARSPGAPDLRVIDGLWREALRQSVHLDVAGGVERAPLADAALLLRVDAAAGQLSVGLLLPERDRTPRPLASVRYANASQLPACLDALAWATRLALGEAITAAPAGVAKIYSSAPGCVRELELASLDRTRGLRGSARDRVGRALRADPGCTLAILAHGHDLLDAGEAAAAASEATRALRILAQRTSPTTRHRLARLALLARAAITLNPRDLQDLHQQLLALGETGVRDRPNDPHARLTRGLAHCYRTEFAAALPDLRTVHERWPGVPSTGYHLCFAELAAGTPDAAVAAITAEVDRLPLERTLLPHALALYAAHRERKLDALFEQADRSIDDASDLHHELQRLRAAHAILRGDADTAIATLLAAVDWIRVRPSRHELLVDSLVECGEVLVLLGAAGALSEQLTGFDSWPSDGNLTGNALTYLQGLVEVETDPDGDVLQTAATTLDNADLHAWSARLRGRLALRAGDALNAASQLATSLRIADEPLARAEFVAVLDLLGRTDEAAALRAETREWLLRVDLRQPLRHPLTGPGRAWAWRRIDRSTGQTAERNAR